jgi:MerR family mercuric resistance operon transcriptional regulator
MRSDGLTIREVSRRTGVKLETIRYYERIGVLTKPARTQNGYRLYDRADLRRLVVVCRIRNFGFSLEETRLLVGFCAAGQASCADVRKIAVPRLLRIRAEIANLSRIAELLEQALERCSTEVTGNCPLIALIVEKEANAIPSK